MSAKILKLFTGNIKTILWIAATLAIAFIIGYLRAQWKNAGIEEGRAEATGVWSKKYNELLAVKTRPDTVIKEVIKEIPVIRVETVDSAYAVGFAEGGEGLREMVGSAHEFSLDTLGAQLDVSHIPIISKWNVKLQLPPRVDSIITITKPILVPEYIEVTFWEKVEYGAIGAAVTIISYFIVKELAQK